MRPFQLNSQAQIAEIGSSVRRLHHEPTGADILIVKNSDPNRCFGITFPTPLRGSTGVAHILEHMVLCGSRRFPDAPFAQLLRGSLHTHLNASTRPDMTTYLAASQNGREFYNLLDVYLDAVLHPLLRESTFRKEGWHVQQGEDGEPRLRGVVYNEMKGFYADPVARAGRELQAALFPDTAYRFDHGGDPEVIPSLSVDALRQFHAEHYRPSNALIYLYGDLDEDDALDFLDQRLDGAGKSLPAAMPPLQPPFERPRMVKRGAPLAGSRKNVVTRGWVLPPAGNPAEALEQSLLAEFLLGSAASPLRHALMVSKIGEALAGEGFFQDTRQPFLAVGLNGVDASVDRFDNIINKAMTDLIHERPSEDLVEAALHRIEFRLRENNGGRHPQGLALMWRVLGPWRWGEDPIALLAFEQLLADLRKSLRERNFLPGKLRKLFADNPHSATVMLYPEQQASVPKTLPAVEPVSTVLEEEVENATSIPTLQLIDLPSVEQHTHMEVVSPTDPLLLFHLLEGGDIAYLDIGFNLRAVPGELWPLVPLFGRLLLEGGTGQHDPEQTAARVARFTGGTSADHRVVTPRGSQQPEGWLFLRSKALHRNFEQMLAIQRDLLFETRLDNYSRFMTILQQQIARHRTQLLLRGHDYVSLALSAALHSASAAQDAMGGISQLVYLDELKKRAEVDWLAVLADLEQLRRLLIRRDGAIISLAATPSASGKLTSAALSFAADLPHDALASKQDLSFPLAASTGFPVATPVNFVGLGLKLPGGQGDDGVRLAAARHIAGTLLWDRVRQEGGAYGAQARYDAATGTLQFLSYRDPHILRTLDVFAAAPAFLRQPVGSEDIRRSIISAFAELDRPRSPGEASLKATLAMLAGDTRERRQQLRDSLLGTSRTDFLHLSELMEAQEKRVAILGSREGLEATLRQRPGIFTLAKPIG
jgi:Zn-dependent M16 (insulinase) family peptidase